MINKRSETELLLPPSVSRRQFVQGLAAGGALMGLGSVSSASPVKHKAAETLRGNQFNLDVNYQPVNFTGQNRMATIVNGSVPAPTLRWREGERVTLRVKNKLAEDTSIHWHGLILPTNMDGVPGLSFAGIKPGETFEYQFDLQQSGTYWYHSHSGFQEPVGMYGAIIIDPRESDPVAYDRDHVVVLSDWSDETPRDIYAKLKKLSHYYNFRERTVGDVWRDIKAKGVAQTWNEREMWNQMRMSETDIADVTGHTYTYLMNGVTPKEGWLGLFKKGEKIRLRFINAASMTLFDVRIPGLNMTVVASDGQNVEPVSIDEFRIAPAETYDVIVEPSDDSAYTVFAQTIDRTGFARGTLTPDVALRSSVPSMDAAPVLGHREMGMGVMSHAGHGQHQMGSIIHAESENGPQVDMRAENPQSGLNDPGMGLRDHMRLHGRRVLTYADLRNLYPTADTREPEREIELHLTGNMSRYMWSLNGIKFSDAEPLHLKHGERVRFTLVNDTMMSHPMHLHGLWSELETGDANHIPRKHTVIVQPGSTISYLVSADAIGRWAYHCHLTYHMPGMFREVRVS